MIMANTMTGITIWTLLTILLAQGFAVSGQEKDIVEKLLSNYGSRSVRPLRDSSQSIHIALRMLIAQIIEFDEPKQKLTVNAWQKLSWRDEYMVWNPDDYNGRDVISVMPGDIWIPRLFMTANVNFDFTSRAEVEVLVSSDGSVIWYAPIFIQVSCKVKVRKFPFDVQHCNITIMSWAYDMSGVNISYFDDADSKQFVFSNNGVWRLIDVEVNRVEQIYKCCAHPFPEITYTLTLERASQFYVFSMLIPSVLLTMITLNVFCMPPESGEKIALGMTNLLAFILFQQLISGNMPPQGDEMPIVTMYIFSMVVVGCASIFASVYVLRLYHTSNDKPIPQRVVRLMKRFSSRRKDRVTWQSVADTVDNVMCMMFLMATCVIICVTFIVLLGV